MGGGILMGERLSEFLGIRFVSHARPVASEYWIEGFLTQLY